MTRAPEDSDRVWGRSQGVQFKPQVTVGEFGQQRVGRRRQAGRPAVGKGEVVSDHKEWLGLRLGEQELDGTYSSEQLPTASSLHPTDPAFGKHSKGGAVETSTCLASHLTAISIDDTAWPSVDGVDGLLGVGDNNGQVLGLEMGVVGKEGCWFIFPWVQLSR